MHGPSLVTRKAALQPFAVVGGTSSTALASAGDRVDGTAGDAYAALSSSDSWVESMLLRSSRGAGPPFARSDGGVTTINIATVVTAVDMAKPVRYHRRRPELAAATGNSMITLVNRART